MATTVQPAAPNLDKSLDDIISSRPRQNRRGGSDRNSARRNIIGGPRTNGSLTRTPRQSPPAVAAPPTANLGTKIIISNLPTDVAEGDVTELFAATVGAVRECQINYARDGRSKGSATVTFVRAGDATKAYNQYNNRLIDGKRPLKIEVVVDLAHPIAPTLAQRVSGPSDTRGSGSRPPRRDDRGEGGGRGGGGRGRGGRSGRGGNNERPKKTAEDLDAEMADYVASTEDAPPA
ncbi:hypothetical protein FRB95_003896 [Tulasnella sp. JGI-2019a]|nr:hypothetical protein FRB95_003896 [Tulasnella sp. JGI-2019a]